MTIATHVRWLRVGLADSLAAWAASRREFAARHRAEWEAETEPGYPMGGLAEQASAISLAIADLQEAIGESIRP